MFSRWAWISWLNLLSEFNSGKDSNRGSLDDKNNRSRFNLPAPNPNKSSIRKIILVLTTLSVIALIFSSFGVKNINLDNVRKDESGIKLISEGGFSERKDEYLLETKNFKNESVYSERLSEGSHRIVIYTPGKWIAFTVSRIRKSQGGYDYSWYSGGKVRNLTKEPKVSGTTKTIECSVLEGSSSTNASPASGTNGTNAFCDLTEWIDLAIINQEPYDKIKLPKLIFSLFPSILHLSILYFVFRWLNKTGSMGLGGASGLFGTGGFLNKTVKSGITFKDVAGIDEVKQEMEEVVDYLKNPTKYRIMGARCPKGIILHGPPGTGKTLLAKAVSGEANVPFLEASGSSFDDMFVGVGAKRVRDLFARARKMAPSIIFIDEIDSVAGKRGNKLVSGGGGLADQTINQLLTEMDGFSSNTGVIVIAATNRLESLDEAILRPGRFDRCIQVPLPSLSGRKKILEIHARNKNISTTVDLEDIARKTHGFSGAQLENILNEAVLMVVRENKKVIKTHHIDEAIDRVYAGLVKKDYQFSFNDRKQIAYHEAGHAIAGLYVKGGEIVEKVTIVPRGRALGFMLSAPEKKDSAIQTREELLAMLTTTLAGRAAEEIFFGADKVGTGAANDLFKATALVRSMVTKFGMSEVLGLIQYEPSEGLENPYKTSYSNKSSERIDEEVLKIVTAQYEEAKKIILDNEKEFLLIAEALLLIETLDRKQISYIHEKKKLPKEAQTVKDNMAKENNE